jgi:uncharacterized protein
MGAIAQIQHRSRAATYLQRAAISLALMLALIYVGIAALAANVVTTPLRRPALSTPAAIGLQSQDVRFPSHDQSTSIAGWYAAAPQATRAIVLVHGKDSSRAREFDGHFVDLAAALRQRGFAVLMIDLRGHGESGPGRFSFGLQERQDVIGAVDWLESQGFARRSVGLLGVSMGAASSIGAAHDDPTIGAIVADCSYAEVYPLMQLHWTEASGLPDIFLPGALIAGQLIVGADLTQARPVAEVGAIEAPLLIIHGAADQFTPVAQGRQLAAAAPRATYWEIPGAGHADSYTTDPASYVTRVVAFFDQALAP